MTTIEYLEHMFSKDGWGTKMLTRVGKLRLLSARHGEAFRSFAENHISGSSFCIADMVLASEAGNARSVPQGKLSEGIYLLSGANAMDPRLVKTLMARSAPGLCGLLSVCPGAELTLPQDCGIELFVRSRFFLLQERDAQAIENAYAQLAGCRLVRAGRVVQGELTFREGNGDVIAWSRKLSEIIPSAVVGMEIGDDCDDYFKDGVQAALTSYAFADLKLNVFFHFPEELTFPQLFMAELGIYDALSAFPVYSQPLRFAEGGTVSLIVPRVYIAAGDRLAAIRPKTDENHRLIPEELQKLRSFLSYATDAGKIKGVLPLKRNTLSMIENLCGESLEYIPSRDIPGGFAVLAVIPAGEEDVGVRLGSFQPR